MTCQQCHARPARYHVTRMVDGGAVEDLHLCEKCAAEQGSLGLAADVTVQQLLASLLGVGAPEAEVGTAPHAVTTERCPQCGQTYAEFAKTGLLGCPGCYDAFSAQLAPLVRRIHGKSAHGGKLPRRTGGAILQRRRVEEMRRQLAEAVAAEAFERAAELRDQIRALEAAGAGPATPGPDAGRGTT